MKNLCLQSITATELAGVPASDWICVTSDPLMTSTSLMVYNDKAILDFDLRSEQVRRIKLYNTEK